MKTYRASLFTRAAYASRGIVACRSDSRPGPHWVECDDAALAGLVELWSGGGVAFYGKP